MTTLCINEPSMQYIPFQDRNTGSSGASKKLSKIVADTFTDLNKASTWDHHRQVFSALRETYLECQSENWDGYSALPINNSTYNDAIRFINALPSYLPSPNIVPEPTGDIGFEWDFGKDRIFVASVDGTNRVTYAGLIGKGNNTQGVETFNGSIPQTIVDQIKRICK